jgi:hypothetical protein
MANISKSGLLLVLLPILHQLLMSCNAKRSRRGLVEKKTHENSVTRRNPYAGPCAHILQGTRKFGENMSSLLAAPKQQHTRDTRNQSSAGHRSPARRSFLQQLSVLSRVHVNRNISPFSVNFCKTVRTSLIVYKMQRNDKSGMKLAIRLS